MPSAWNMFVKKIYEEGKAEDPNYEFKQALVDASKRKSEMGNSGVASGVKTRVKKSKRSRSVKRSRGRTASASAAMAGGKKRRTRRRHRR
jgi:hypothetical protein